MWAEFFVSFLVGALCLVAPGAAVCRGARLPWAYALAAAPGCSVALYCLIALGFSAARVPLSGIALLAATAAAAAAAYGGLRFLVRRGSLGAMARADRPSLVFGWELGLYLAVGVLTTLLILVKPFDDPSMPTQAWDNVFHFGVIRAFLDSGDWSFMGVAQYKTPVDLAIDPFPGTKFYPAAWHVLAALLADAAQVPVVVAANAVNVLFAGVVFPAGMFALLNVLFPDRRSAVALGAVACMSFVAFPWALYTSWQLFPNAAATAVLPSLAFLFVAAVERFCGLRRRQLGVPLCLVLMAVGILQPNAAFSAAVFLAPYCIGRVGHLAGEAMRRRGGRPAAVLGARIAAAAAAAAVIAAIWIGLFLAPFMGDVVGYHWASYATAGEALENAVTLSLAYNPPQKVLAVFVLVGFVVAFRRARTAWLSFSYAFSLVIFVVATATDGMLKQVLAGFWYTDPCRVGALLAFAAMPLAALGMSSIYRLLTGWARGRFRSVVCMAGAVVVGVACFCGSYFIPTELGEGDQRYEETPFEYLEKQNEVPPSPEEAESKRPYNEEKAAFAEKVKAIVGDAVVVNQPYDGSLYLYGVDGLHLLYRYMSGYGEEEGETAASQIIRECLDQYATNPVVREAVRQTHARYVLQLSADGRGVGRFGPSFHPERWEGITAIGPDTPGFTLVLAQGNMRLYRIDGAAGLKADPSLLKEQDALMPDAAGSADDQVSSPENATDPVETS